MLLTNDAGTVGSTAAISARMAFAAASGGPTVSTTQYMLFANQTVVGSGTCEIGTYTSIGDSFSSPKCLTLPTTPTTSTSLGGFVPSSSRMRAPIGSAPRQNCRARASLTMATGWESARSADVKILPSRT